MSKKNSKKGNPGARAAILLVVVGVPVLFFAVSKGTAGIMDWAPYIVALILLLLATVYAGLTAKLLYDYYNVEAPWYRFVPCFGELTLMDSKYLKIGGIFYALAVIAFGASRLPYDMLKFMGDNLAISFPFYATAVTFVMLIIVQVIKGIGLAGCMHVISLEWKDKMNGSLGAIGLFRILGFIPFVRVLSVYAMNKPLSTLVTFNNIHQNDSNDVVLNEVE